MSHIDLSTLVLAKGSHRDRESGTCLLEAVAYFAGEPHSDAPTCVSPVLRSFGIGLNDVLPDDKRQRLVPFVPRMVGTANDGLDEARGFLALDWSIRIHTPAWLDLAGLVAEAQALRDLRQIVDLASAQDAGPAVRQGAKKAAASRDAVRDAAGWAAVRDAAGWTPVRDAAGWDTAATAARAARDAGDAGDASLDASWVAAWVAAWTAPGAALASTVDALQDSAITLLDAMITPALLGGAR